MERMYNLKKGQSEYPDAFDGVAVPIPFPAPGTDEEATLTLTGPDAETVGRMIEDAGSAKNALCLYVSAAILARQKAVKAVAGSEEVAKLLTDGKTEEAVQKVLAAAGETPTILIREFSEGGAKRRTAKAKAREEIKSEATSRLEELDAAEREAAEALLRKLNLI